MPPKLLLERVGLSYGRRVIFQNLHAEMKGGEGWAIVGPNGSGKSSLLSLIAGYRMPAHGQVKHTVSLGELAWQSPHVQPPPDTLVRDVVEDWRCLKVAEVSPAFYDTWDLPPERPLYALSSGMKQRLFVALALSLRRGIILLDEPTAFMDATYRQRTHAELRQRIGIPELLLLCATNDPAEAELFPNVLHLHAYAA